MSERVCVCIGVGLSGSCVEAGVFEDNQVERHSWLEAKPFNIDPPEHYNNDTHSNPPSPSLSFPSPDLLFLESLHFFPLLPSI